MNDSAAVQALTPVSAMRMQVARVLHTTAQQWGMCASSVRVGRSLAAANTALRAHGLGRSHTALLRRRTA